jgi:hypothetical protein
VNFGNGKLVFQPEGSAYVTSRPYISPPLKIPRQPPNPKQSDPRKSALALPLSGIGERSASPSQPRLLDLERPRRKNFKKDRKRAFTG